MNFIENILKDQSNVHIYENKRDFVEQTIRSLINGGRKILKIGLFKS